MHEVALISRLSYVFFCYVFSVTKHQILSVAIVVNLVYTYLTRIQFMYERQDYFVFYGLNPIEI